MIPFNSPPVVGSELEYMQAAMRSGKLSGDGAFTRRCQQWLEHYSGSCKVLLTPSCTASLEMAALLLNIQPGGTSGAPPLSYAAEKGGMVLQGAFELELDGQTLQLQRGDSFQFDGATPHVFRNPYDEPASILWIIAHEPAAQRHF